MNLSKISVRYSKALFLTSQEKNVLERVNDDMLLLYNTCLDIEEFNKLLENPIVPSSTKRKIIKSVFSGNVHEITLSFLYLILKNNREAFLENITRVFLDLYRKKMGFVSVSLTTAISIDDVLRKKIIEIINTAYKADVEMTEFVNENILGGFKLQIEDNLLDASVSTSLNKFKRELLKK
ncbi:MAG: ATP synthase F1 subunit delta [Bacteroidales bacterium]|nr:ATP synthase F1 subunit delta [Bacteroidales bacterium]